MKLELPKAPDPSQGPYGIEMEVDHAGLVFTLGYDWSDLSPLSELLVKLGVDPETAMQAQRQAAFAAASEMLK